MSLRIVLAFVFALAALETHAGVISGRVLYEEGPLPGARVELSGRVGFNEGVVSDEAGQYTLTFEQAGTYTLRARLDGMETVAREVCLSAADVVSYDVRMRMGFVSTGGTTIVRNEDGSPIEPRPRQLSEVSCTGTVRDQRGAPVAAAPLRARGTNSVATLTDVEGRFAIRLSVESSVALTVETASQQREEILLTDRRSHEEMRITLLDLCDGAAHTATNRRTKPGPPTEDELTREARSHPAVALMTCVQPDCTRVED